jgi:cytochrome c biogenesis protein CcmG, thiol:disulfide interchange protein DsbE
LLKHRKTWSLLLAGVLILLGIGYWLSKPQAGAKSSGAQVGKAAPQLRGETLEGKELSLAALRGKPVVINAFASWCGPCRIEMPHLTAVYNNRSSAVHFIGLNVQEATGDVAAFREEFQIPYPIVLDPDGELTNGSYRSIGLPTTWFVDADGIIHYIHTGPMTEEMINEQLDEILSGSKRSEPEPPEPAAGTPPVSRPEPEEIDEYEIITLLPPDAIPSIDTPTYLSRHEADQVYAPDELVIGVVFDGDARAYSVPVLSRHEIVNDTVGGQPISVTW